MPIPDKLLDVLVEQVLERRVDPRTMSDSELLAVSHVFLDEDCALPPTEAVFDEVERRGLSGEK
jgi:hypothetical protein